MKNLENKTPIWFWIFAIPFTLPAVSDLTQLTSIFSDELP